MLPSRPPRRDRHRTARRLAVFLGWVGAGAWPLLPVGQASVVVDTTLPPEVAATVNGEAIPQKLVDTFLKNDREALALDPATAAGRQALAELPGHILDELADRALIGQGARELGVAPTDKNLDAAEQEMVTFCGNPARYGVYLAQNGMTRTEYRETILRTKLNGQAMIGALTKDLTATDAEMHAYYDAHTRDADFQWPERVSGAHILINTRPGVLSSSLETAKGLAPGTPEMQAAVEEETRRRQQLAEAIREKALLPGADFAALAGQYSEDEGTRTGGGSLGTFARGVHPVVLDDAFFKLAAGEVGPVVHTDFGFHVIRAAAHLPAGARTFDESAPEIRRRLLQEKGAQIMRAWLVKARAAARIVVHAPNDPPK